MGQLLGGRPGVEQDAVLGSTERSLLRFAGVCSGAVLVGRWAGRVHRGRWAGKLVQGFESGLLLRDEGCIEGEADSDLGRPGLGAGRLWGGLAAWAAWSPSAHLDDTWTGLQVPRAPWARAMSTLSS